MEAFTDADLDAVCNEICDIGDQVWASPVQGWTDIIERALVAHYGFRDEDTKKRRCHRRARTHLAVLAYSPTAWERQHAARISPSGHRSSQWVGQR